MKKIKIVVLIVLLTFCNLNAQVSKQPNWQFSPRLGYDFPTYSNNTPFIDYKGGINIGVSADYYWTWFGLGADIDYIKNKPVSIFPTNNLVNGASVALTSFSLDENGISRFFYGLGPNFRYQNKSQKFTAELNTRLGFTSIKGGRTELRETTTLAKDLLNFHAGYNLSSVFTVKSQLKLTYFLNESFGVNLGAYYFKPFKGTELKDNTLGMSTGYQPVKTDPNTGITSYDGSFKSRVEPCNCDISSVGFFAGITYKLGFKNKVPTEICEPIYGLTVTARDKFTRELLLDTEVVVKNIKGETINSGRTNSFGVVVFEKMMPEDYTISGTLNTIALEGSSVLKSEFIKNTNVQKEIIYSDRNFIVKGRIFACNTTNPISKTQIVLENKANSEIKTTLTDAQGNFMIQLPAAGNYTLYGKKDNYFSQIEDVNPSNYSREKVLFVKLEICAEQADCGKAIGLKNILYDLDKFFIKDQAKVELNKLVRFMTDNPTVKVEVGSHTDCRSSDEYNKTLSQNRASAAVDYVVSQGIDRTRISGVGYGESKLLNRCGDGVDCTEAEHSINRRTEMKVICPDKN